MKYTVIGAGSWGTTVSSLLAPVVPTTIWARRAKVAENIDKRQRNRAYLKGFTLPIELSATDNLSDAVDEADVIFMAVPSHGYRDVLTRVAGDIPDDIPIISLTKGIEAGTLMRMTEVTADVLPDHDADVIGVMTGPNLAKEIMDGQPAGTVIAMQNQDIARTLQSKISGPRLRVYTNTDVIGSESAGAVKNVMAIASGMAAGQGFGDNTLATLVTRALVEMARLGIAMGGRARTFAGLAGIGDLIATCSSRQSRNFRVGYGLGQGRDLEEIIDEMQMVAEGVKSTSGILALSRRYEVDMPIADKVGEVLYDGLDVTEALHQLMTREVGEEFQA